VEKAALTAKRMVLGVFWGRLNSNFNLLHFQNISNQMNAAAIMVFLTITIEFKTDVKLVKLVRPDIYICTILVP
jgi:hypothetical protein